MSKKDEALKLALENAQPSFMAPGWTLVRNEDITALREALVEQPAQQQAGEPITQTFTGLPGRKLRDLLSAGWWVNGVCFQRTEEDGTVRRGAITTGGMVLWWNQPAQQQEPVTVLPDGSAFAVMSYPLPKDHWLYADRQYNDGEYEPVELGKPVLTHELRDAVVSAVRYAIRGATNCGKEVDFDPDALVKNAVYALCGPFTLPQPAQQHDYWQEEARRYAQNADFWRGKYEAATAQQQEPVAWMYQCSADSSGPVLMQHKRDWAESGSGLWTETPLYTSPQPAQQQEPVKLWLWKNFVDGRPEYWAFDNAFPINMNDGDPQTVGEPCGYAWLKPSRQGRLDLSYEEVRRGAQSAKDYKPWVGLTQEECEFLAELPNVSPTALVRVTEIKLREKNA